MSKLIASGYTEKDKGTRYAWWVYPAMSLDEAEKVIRDMNIVSYLGSPGMPFTDKPLIRLSRRYTVITQLQGFDV